MLIVTALGMFDSMKAYIDWEFGTITNFDYKLSLSEDYTDNQLGEIISKYGNSSSQTFGVEFKQNDEIIVKQLTVNNSKGLLQVTDHNRRPFEMKSNGIYITEKMSSIYGLNIGDTVEWHIIGKDNWYETEIVGFVRDPQNQQFNCTKEFFDTLNDEYKADTIYTNQDLGDLKEIPGVNTIQTVQNLKDGMNSMLSMMYSVIALLIVISIILACVIIYNLGILIPFIGTTLGSAMVFLMKNKINNKIEKLLLGFASGVMIAASIWSLIIPSIDMAESQGITSWIPATIGFLLGVCFLLVLDSVIPHLHLNSDKPEGVKSKLKKTTMMILAVTLHNIPEGMAVGVVMAGAITQNSGITMAGAFALAIRNCYSKLSRRSNYINAT